LHKVLIKSGGLHKAIPPKHRENWFKPAIDIHKAILAPKLGVLGTRNKDRRRGREIVKAVKEQYIIQAKGTRDGSSRKQKFIQRYQSKSVPKRLVRTNFNYNARGFKTYDDAQAFLTEINNTGGFFLLDFTIIKMEEGK
jgi:hypothetical protein